MLSTGIKKADKKDLGVGWDGKIWTKKGFFPLPKAYSPQKEKDVKINCTTKNEKVKKFYEYIMCYIIS